MQGEIYLVSGDDVHFGKQKEGQTMDQRVQGYFLSHEAESLAAKLENHLPSREGHKICR